MRPRPRISVTASATQRNSACCPGCKRTLPLQAFRKWWGSKRTLRTLCIHCEPEKSLEAMTPEERAQALDHPRPFATLARVTRLNEADATAQTQRRVKAATKRHAAQRTRNWAPVMRALRAELDWAQGHALAPPPGAVGAAWGAFFAAYAAALTDAVRRARAASSGTSRLVPLPEQTHALYWLEEITINNLRRLYSACAPIPGRRLYRDPLFLCVAE